MEVRVVWVRVYSVITLARKEAVPCHQLENIGV